MSVEEQNRWVCTQTGNSFDTKDNAVREDASCDLNTLLIDNAVCSGGEWNVSMIANFILANKDVIYAILKSYIT